jgi:hypothetical protein
LLRVVADLSDLALSALGLWAPVARADPAGQAGLEGQAGLVVQADRAAQVDQGAWAVQLGRAQVVLAVQVAQVVQDARVRVVDEIGTTAGNEPRSAGRNWRGVPARGVSYEVSAPLGVTGSALMRFQVEGAECGPGQL